MEVFIPLSEVFLTATVHTSLQLQLGSLLLLYHASLGKHIRVKTRQLVGSYIAGIGTLVLCSLLAMCFTMDRFFGSSLYPEEMLIVIMMLLALAVIVWVFYYRRGKSTELWLPRSVARYIDKRAKTTTSNTEAFSLGLLTCFAEAPFVLPLFVVASNSVLGLPFEWQLLAVALYTIIAILPGLIMRTVVRRGQTIVDIQRWRVKHKSFFRFLSGFGFIVLALFLFAFEVFL